MPAVKGIPAAVLIAALLMAACGGDGPTGMRVTSPAFAAGQPIPERFSCLGENVPPPLRWKGTPEGTAELAVVVEDRDAPEGTFVHWIMVGIDPGTTRIESDALPPGARVLLGSSDNPTYIGPCPPRGSGTHRYSFEVYALPRRVELAESSPPAEKARAIRRAASAGGRLEGTFRG